MVAPTIKKPFKPSSRFAGTVRPKRYGTRPAPNFSGLLNERVNTGQGNLPLEKPEEAGACATGLQLVYPQPAPQAGRLQNLGQRLSGWYQRKVAQPAQRLLERNAWLRPEDMRHATVLSVWVHILSPLVLALSVAILALLVWLVLHIPLWDLFRHEPPRQNLVFTIVPPSQDAALEEAERIGPNAQQAGQPVPPPEEPAQTKPTPKPEVTPTPEPAPQPVKKPSPEPPPAETKAQREGVIDPKPTPEAPPPEAALNQNLPEMAEAVVLSEPGANNKPGVDVKPDKAFSEFMDDLDKRIQHNWHPPRGSKSKKVAVMMEIGKDGKLIKAEIKDPSGNENFDKSAILAAEQASPYLPLPETYEHDSIAVLYTFDYTVYGGNLFGGAEEEPDPGRRSQKKRKT